MKGDTMTKKREKQLQALAQRGGSIHSINMRANRERNIFDPDGRFATFNDRQFVAIMKYVAAIVHNHAMAIGFYDNRSQADTDLLNRWQ
jgi:hypothetical protein